jgi:hypothetical protein
VPTRPSTLIYCFSLWIAGACSAGAQTLFTVPASQSSNIQADGPKQGANSDKYFNIEGGSNKNYADYGVLRFDISHLRADLDKKFGPGRYKITGVTLHLTQSNARFTRNGGVNFYFTPDDATDIRSRTSPLKYPYHAAGSALRGELIVSGKFVQGTSNGKKGKEDKNGKNGKIVAGTGQIDHYDLFKGHGGQTSLPGHLLKSKTLTLVVSEGEPGVAATWAGQSANGNLKPPVLTVIASPTGSPPPRR